MPVRQPRDKQDKPHLHKVNPTLAYVIGSLLAIAALQWVVATIAQQQLQTIPYSEFLTLVTQGQVADVSVGPTAIEGQLRNGKGAFVTDRLESKLTENLTAKGVVVRGKPSAGWLITALPWVAPLFFFYLVWSFLLRRRVQVLVG